MVDASIALAWVFPGEGTSRTDELLDRVEETGGVVPRIWAMEVANALLVAERRGRQTEAETSRVGQYLAGLNLAEAEDPGVLALTTLVPLARQHHLTVYDAAYLHLAIRLDLPLATNDEALASAARDVGLEVL